MAEVKFFKSILEDSYETFTIEPGMTVEATVRKYGDDEAYTSNLVECYDLETGKTFYAPLTDNSDFGIVAVVNGKEVSKDYELKENDSAVIIITPMSGSDDNWNWTGAWVGLAIGALLGGITGGVAWWYAYTSFAEEALWVGLGAMFGMATGFVAGGLIGAQIENKKKTNDYDKTQLPDIGGAANQPITGNPIPLILGKKEVTPFIIGSPWVEYKGLGGKDAWIHVLYCVGYGPLNISRIKFDCLPVTDNARGVIQGKLSGMEINGGDIKTKWATNTPEFEIIQQDLNSKQLYVGDIYPVAKKQVQVNSVPMFIRDDYLTDASLYNQTSKKLINYMNQNYDNGFRNSPIRFSEQYAKKIELVINVPEGLYYEKATDDGVPEKKSIPLNLAIQWRPYSETAEAKERVEKNHRSDGNYPYEFDSMGTDGWIPFDYIRADDSTKYAPELYDRKADIAAHTGNNLHKEQTTKTSKLDNQDAVQLLCATEQIQRGTYPRGQIIGYETYNNAKDITIDEVSFHFGLFGFIKREKVTLKDGTHGKRHTWEPCKPARPIHVPKSSVAKSWWTNHTWIETNDFHTYVINSSVERYKGEECYAVYVDNWPQGYSEDDVIKEFTTVYDGTVPKVKYTDVPLYVWDTSIKIRCTHPSVPGGTSEISRLTWEFAEGSSLSSQYHFVDGEEPIYLPVERPSTFAISEEDYRNIGTVRKDGVTYRAVLCTNWPYKDEVDTEKFYCNENWEKSKVFNLQKVQNKINGDKEDLEEITQFRVTAVADLEKFCNNHNLAPSEFLYSPDNTTKAIEVRVIRISPNYINEVAGDDNNKKPKTFHDSIQWTNLTSEIIDTDGDVDDLYETTLDERRTELLNLQRSLHTKVDMVNAYIISLSTYEKKGWSEFVNQARGDLLVLPGKLFAFGDAEYTSYVYATPVNSEGEILTENELRDYIDTHYDSTTGKATDPDRHIFFVEKIESSQFSLWTNPRKAIDEKIANIRSALEKYYSRSSGDVTNFMKSAYPISPRHYRNACLLALKIKADPAGNVQGQLEKLSVIAQAFTPKLKDRTWFPLNITKKNRYFLGDKTELFDEVDKTAKKKYEEAIANGDTKATCVHGGNNWRNEIDKVLFARNIDPVKVAGRSATFFAEGEYTDEEFERLTSGWASDEKYGRDIINSQPISLKQNEFYYIYAKNTDTKKDYYIFLRAGSDYDASPKVAVKAELLELQELGNVNLLTRKKVSSEVMQNAGWKDCTKGYATVYSCSYDEDGVYITVTPIRADGTVLSPEELGDYVDSLFRGEEDWEGLLLARHTSKEESDAFGVRLHELQETFYEASENFDFINYTPITGKNLSVGNDETYSSWYLSDITYTYNGEDAKEYGSLDLTQDLVARYSNPDIEGDWGKTNNLEIKEGDLFYIKVHNTSLNTDHVLFVRATSNSSSGSCTGTTVMMRLDHENNSSPSQFMYACVGPLLGKDALGYEDINLLSIAQWHDDAVDVVDGTTHPGTEFIAHIFMECNGYVYSRMKFEDILSKIAVSGRAGYTRDDNGKYVAVMDSPVPYPKGILNNQNALSVTISYSFLPSPSGVAVNFKNAENFGIDETLMVMNDDEDWKHPTNDVEMQSLDFVTSAIQTHSFGRYYLANKEFSRNAITWKAGIEGFDLQFGDVIKVNHDMLLVGQSCGRITEVIEKDGVAYGLILSDAYEYDGKPDHAIEVMQPSQYGKDRVIVIPVNNKEVDIKYYDFRSGKEKTLRNPKVGVVNYVTFDEPITLGDDYKVGEKMYFFKPQLDNLVNYGFKDRVSRLYRIRSKTPDTNFSFTFSLVPYDERFYDYGCNIPNINRNITVPSRVTDSDIKIDDKATLNDVLERMEEAKSYADEAIAEATFDATAVYQLAIATPVLTKNPDGTYVKDELILKSKKTSGTTTEVYPTVYHVTYFDSENVEQHLYDSKVPEVSVTLTDLPTDTLRFHVSANYWGEDGREVEFDNQDVQIIESGEQGYTVGLTNENHGFPGDTEKALESVATTSVYALSGDRVTEARVVSVDKLDVSLDFVNTSIPGLKFKVSTLQKAERPVITFKATPDLIVQSGNVSVIIEVNKIQIEKSFSFTVSRKGEDGDVPYVLVIEGENIIRNGDGTVTLTPSLTKGGKEVEIIPPEMKIQWYLNNEASRTYAAGNYVSDAKLELTAHDVGNKILINCKLEDSLG